MWTVWIPVWMHAKRQGSQWNIFMLKDCFKIGNLTVKFSRW